MWRFDAKGACDFLNVAWVEFTGMEMAEGLGEGWLETVHPGDRERLQAAFAEALVERESFTLEFRLRTADGAYHWMRDKSVPLYDANEEFVGLMGSCLDIQDERSSAQLREDFLHIVGHQIRTPLTVITGFAQMLETQPDIPKDRIKELAAKILERAGVIADLTEELMRALEVRSGELELQYGTFDPLGFAQVCAIQSAHGEEHRIHVAGEGRLEPIHADRRRLYYALENLVTNALKYSPPEACVRVTVSAQGVCTVFSVSDEGKGIEREDLDRIWGKFVRIADSSEGDDIGGHGVGLYITQRIVESHGGHIEAESDPGVGSTFRIFVPTRGKKHRCPGA